MSGINDKQERKGIMLHVHLPSQMARYFDELKVVRSEACEPLSNTAIVIDALKALHRQKVKK